MAASRADIHGWLMRAKRNGATHVLVVCDTFDHEDYPVEVTPDQDVNERLAYYRAASMQNVMEVYALHLSIQKQLSEQRAFHTESAPLEGTTADAASKEVAACTETSEHFPGMVCTRYGGHGGGHWWTTPEQAAEYQKNPDALKRAAFKAMFPGVPYPKDR